MIYQLTAHTEEEEPVICNGNRFCETYSKAKTTRHLVGDHSRKELPIPCICRRVQLFDGSIRPGRSTPLVQQMNSIILRGPESSLLLLISNHAFQCVSSLSYLESHHDLPSPPHFASHCISCF